MKIVEKMLTLTKREKQKKLMKIQKFPNFNALFVQKDFHKRISCIGTFYQFMIPRLSKINVKPATVVSPTKNH